MSSNNHNSQLLTCGMLFALASSLGCHRDMQDQPRYDVLEASDFFQDGKSARPLVAGTVPRGRLQEDSTFDTGKTDGKLATEIPLTIDRALLERGQERFNIYCSVCHGRVGAGDGMIVQRGFRQPPSYHTDRLRSLPDGHYFDVITNGFGTMPSYRVQLPLRDRWAVVAYVRVLQRSQNATLNDVPADERSKLEEAVP